MRWKDIVKYHGNKYVLFGTTIEFPNKVKYKLYKIVDEKPGDPCFFHHCRVRDVTDKELREQIKEYVEYGLWKQYVYDIS